MDGSGWARFEHSFDLLSDDLPEIPSSAGVYILMSERTLFTYPAGASSVFYIGLASDLKVRLLDHRKFSHQVKNGEAATRYFPRYEWAANHGAIATYAVRPRKNSTLKPKDIESLLLASSAKHSERHPSQTRRAHGTRDSGARSANTHAVRWTSMTVETWGRSA